MRLVGAVLAGLGLACSFAPVNAWYLAPLAVALFVWILREQRWWQSAIWGFITGFVYAEFTVHWLRHVGEDTVFMLGGLFGLWFLALGIAIGLVWKLPLAPLWVASVWVLIEFGYANVPLGGFGWLRLAFGQADGIFLDFASYVGVAGVGFFVALVGALIVRGIEHLTQAQTQHSALKPLGFGLASLAIVALILGAGGVAMTLKKYAYEFVSVGVVQGDVPGTGLDSLGEKAAVVKNHVAATKQLAQAINERKVVKPELIVWPENSTDIDPITNMAVRANIDSVVNATNVPVLVGAVRNNPANRTTLQNTGILWEPSTGAGQEYVKRHLVPFGEYMPFRSLIARYTDRVNLVPYDFVSGDQPGVFEVNGRRYGDLICYEILSDSAVRSTVAEDVNVLVMQANNATYNLQGSFGQAEAEQLLDIARVRAVESSRSVVVATTNGITAVVDPSGKVIDQIPAFEPGFMVSEVPIYEGNSWGIFVGRYIEYGLALLGLLAFVAGIVAVNRKKSD